ncbi:alkaline phosphatase family protein [Nanoarchaeota archaeon]
MSLDEKLNGILISVDGLIYSIFLELLKNGELPNIQEHIYDRALVNVDRAICCHPSATDENKQAIITGMFPHDPGGVAFLRETGAVYNRIGEHILDRGDCAKRPTIHHHLDGTTASIYSPWNSGVTYGHPFWDPKNGLKYLAGISKEKSNEVAVSRFKSLVEERQPKFTEVYFYAYDRFGHTIKSEEKLKNKYRLFDKYVGQIVQILKDNNLYENTLISFLSDHSMGVDLTESVDFKDVCFNAGFKPEWYNQTTEADSVALAYGFSVGQIYLKDGIGVDGITDKLKDRINGLLSQDSVEHAIIKLGDKRIVYSKNGNVAEITKEDHMYKMEILKGSHLFGFKEDLCDALSEYHRATESLVWTNHYRQPDAVVKIAESMHHPDSPDIMVLAPKDFDYAKTRNPKDLRYVRNGNEIRTHGTLHDEHSQIPFVIAGPEIISRVNVKTARSIDWMPTFLELAGYGVPPGLDGRSLLQVER